MQSLKNFDELVNAFKEISANKSFDHDNGTRGKTFKCYLYNVDSSFVDKDVRKAQTELVNLTFAKASMEKLAAANETLVQAKLKAASNESTTMLEFRLVTPIALLTGTKEHQVTGIAEIRRIKMKDVKSIFIRQSDIMLDLVAFEPIEGEFAVNSSGKQAKIINMTLVDCLLEPELAIKDWKGTQIVPERAIVYQLSKKTLQTIGRIAGYAKKELSKNLGIFTAEELGIQ